MSGISESRRHPLRQPVRHRRERVAVRRAGSIRPSPAFAATLLKKGELTGILPQPIWLEFSHRLMLAEAAMKHGRLPGNPAAFLARRPDIVRSLNLNQSKVRNLLGFGLRFESCTQDDLLQSSFALQRRHGLLTNDSAVLAMAIRLEADCLASNDNSLQIVEEIAVFAPSDLRI